MVQTQQEAMRRKPILMPPSMISKIDRIAQSKKVSFAEVVRDAVDAYDADISPEESELLEAMADALIKSTQETIKKIEALEKRLDETHAILEARHGNR